MFQHPFFETFRRTILHFRTRVRRYTVLGLCVASGLNRQEYSGERAREQRPREQAIATQAKSPDTLCRTQLRALESPAPRAPSITRHDSRQGDEP